MKNKKNSYPNRETNEKRTNHDHGHDNKNVHVKTGPNASEKSVYDDYVLVNKTKHANSPRLSKANMTKPNMSASSTANREANGNRYSNNKSRPKANEIDDFNPKHDLVGALPRVTNQSVNDNLTHSNKSINEQPLNKAHNLSDSQVANQDAAKHPNQQQQDIPKRYSSMRNQRNSKQSDKQFNEEDPLKAYAKQQTSVHGSPQQFINHTMPSYYDPNVPQWHMSPNSASQVPLNHPTQQIPYGPHLAHHHHHLINANSSPQHAPAGLTVAPQSPQLIQTQFYGFNYHHMPADYVPQYATAQQSPGVVPTAPIYYANTVPQAPINMPLHRQSKAIPIVNPEVSFSVLDQL